MADIERGSQVGRRIKLFPSLTTSNLEHIVCGEKSKGLIR
jgi:hypothetical protein